MDTSLVFEDPLTVKPEVEESARLRENPNFAEVPRALLRPERWRQLWNAPFNGKVPLHVLECRSVLSAVKHMCRDSRKHGCRFLVLNDNIGVCLAVQKGRACDYGLIRLIRRISAHVLACGMKLHVRWIASEDNAADKGSREPKFDVISNAAEAGGGSVHKAGGGRGKSPDGKDRAVSGAQGARKEEEVSIAAPGLVTMLKATQRKRDRARARQKRFAARVWESTQSWRWGV